MVWNHQFFSTLQKLGDIFSIASNLINGSFHFGVSVKTDAEEIRRVRKSSCPAGDDKGMVEQRDIECTRNREWQVFGPPFWFTAIDFTLQINMTQRTLYHESSETQRTQAFTATSANS
uniref:Uncharacterized protein n=1 Tax=Glossina pallidipes TaxID=7398 RepID=A0A1A9ZX85_GLOPL